MRSLLLIALMGTALVLGGCTARYSHTITGSIVKINSYKVVNTSSGTDVGLNWGGAYVKAANGIAFKKPKGPAELANYPCDKQLVEVDYRSKFYVYWIRVDFPEVKVTNYCIKN